MYCVECSTCIYVQSTIFVLWLTGALIGSDVHLLEPLDVLQSVVLLVVVNSVSPIHSDKGFGNAVCNTGIY